MWATRLPPPALIFQKTTRMSIHSCYPGTEVEQLAAPTWQAARARGMLDAIRRDVLSAAQV